MNEINIGDVIDLGALPLKLDFDSEFQKFGGVDPDKFIFTYPWGNKIINNQEQQGYPNDPLNMPSGHSPLIMRDGALIIRCTPTCWMDKEVVHGQPFTSALISTETKYNFYRGMISSSIRFPKGKGSFPAFWSLIEGFRKIKIPEWDIVENLGHTGKILYHTLHSNMNLQTWGSPKVGEAQKQLIEPVVGGIDYSDDFHEFSGIWTEQWLYWLIDRKCVFKFRTPLDFNHGLFVQRYMIANLAYGSGWSREQPQYDLKYAPDKAVFPEPTFPLEMAIKYIRAYTFTNDERYRYPTLKADAPPRTLPEISL